MKTYLHLESWGGRSKTLVEILDEYSKRYKVRLLENCLKGSKGKIVLVPKYAISKENDSYS
jgi:hypothetical protein